jgi:hypothetical protein
MGDNRIIESSSLPVSRVRAWLQRMVPRDRFAAGVLVVLLLLVAIGVLAPGPSRPVLIVYGDSLTVQSESAALKLHPHLDARVVFRAAGGTAMCDWIAQARYDRLALDPKKVVLAFTGNTATCAAAAFLHGGVPATTALYEHSLRQMGKIFSKQEVSLVIPPAMHNLPHGFYPYNGNPALVAMYKRVGAELGMSINTEANDTLTPGHVFTSIRPAYPDGPPVTVRLSDGVHLTPAGELWYGAALLH